MYFCKNCGEPYMTDEAVMCVKCGVAKGQGNNYCHNCGKAVTQLVLSIVGILLCCVVVGVFIVMGVGIWGLVEGIMILTGKIDTDGKGNPLAD